HDGVHQRLAAPLDAGRLVALRFGDHRCRQHLGGLPLCVGRADAAGRFAGHRSTRGALRDSGAARPVGIRMLRLTDDEKAMLDGHRGKATQKAMDLLVRYAEALGADRFLDTKNVAGVPGSANAFLQNYFKDKGGPAGDAIFSFFEPDADELGEARTAL